jgi:PLP dependent protein
VSVVVQPVEDARRAEIADNLVRVRARIAAACAAAGRPAGDVTLIAVTKTYPAEDVLRLAALGVVDVGENRDQEAAPKAAEAVAVGADLRWHYIGQLQRNKARSVVRYADVVHSVDRLPLVDALADAAGKLRDGRPLDVLLQVSLDGEEHRGGALPANLDRLAEAVAARPALRLGGLMAVAPLGAEGAGLDRAFTVLAEASARLRADHPEATTISAGMSGDLESAIGHGATHVRVGSALLGQRARLG